MIYFFYYLPNFLFSHLFFLYFFSCLKKTISNLCVELGLYCLNRETIILFLVNLGDSDMQWLLARDRVSKRDPM